MQKPPGLPAAFATRKREEYEKEKETFDLLLSYPRIVKKKRGKFLSLYEVDIKILVFGAHAFRGQQSGKNRAPAYKYPACHFGML